MGLKQFSPPDHLHRRNGIWERQDVTSGRIADEVPVVVGAADEDKATARLGERHDYPIREIVGHELLDSTTGPPRVEMVVVGGPYRCEEQSGVVRPIGSPQVEIDEIGGREHGEPRVGDAAEAAHRLGRQPGEDFRDELRGKHRSVLAADRRGRRWRFLPHPARAWRDVLPRWRRRGKPVAAGRRGAVGFVGDGGVGKDGGALEQSGM